MWRERLPWLVYCLCGSNYGRHFGMALSKRPSWFGLPTWKHFQVGKWIPKKNPCSSVPFDDLIGWSYTRQKLPSLGFKLGVTPFEARFSVSIWWMQIGTLARVANLYILQMEGCTGKYVGRCNNVQDGLADAVISCLNIQHRIDGQDFLLCSRKCLQNPCFKIWGKATILVRLSGKCELSPFLWKIAWQWIHAAQRLTFPRLLGPQNHQIRCLCHESIKPSYRDKSAARTIMTGH